MKTLIVGAGEVGKALKEVVSKLHGTLIRDIEPIDIGDNKIEVLHICYPEGPGFVENTNKYIDLYKPSLTIINSSVSIGTCDRLGDKIVYSPIRGRHMRNGQFSLAQDIRLFVKFVFCKDAFKRDMACAYFEDCGLTCYSFKYPNAGEALKLLSNIHMGIEIAWRQEVQRILKEFDVQASTYELWEETYAQGYEKTGDSHLIRPRMSPNPIGGHCIIPCTEILAKQFPSKILDFILESNEKTKTE